MSPALKTRLALLACAPALFGLLPGAAAAADAPTTGAPLTPELSTLAEPAVAAAPEAAQAEAISLPAEGPGSLVREGEDVVVEASFEGGAPARTALEAAGATVLETSARYQTVALAVAPEDLGALAEVPGLTVVKPALEPVFYGTEETGPGAGTSALSAASPSESCEGGSVTSQAMTQLRVAAARGAFGARGAGQTIGVISDSFDTATEAIGGGPVATEAADDEATNDLPGPSSTCSGQQVPVNVVAEGPAASTDEGRAMLQVIHDLAPHAGLAFATAYSTELQFARNIERLAEPVAAGGGGANVIVDDVGYFAEPFYQDGPVAVAIRKVTAAGVTYLTAAGNDNLIESGTGNEFGSWERNEFVDAACPSAIASGVGEASSSCMNFSPTATADPTFGITVERESTLVVDLQWAEAWYGVETDLNAYLLNAAGNVIVAEPVKNVGSGAVRQPIELFGWENTTTKAAEVQLVTVRCAHNCNAAANVKTKPRLKFMLMEDGAGVAKTEYPKSAAAGITVGPTIYGHAGSAAAITLAAVNYEKSATAPTEPERYSSRGPVTHYFGPVNGMTKAAKLSTAEVLEKPNATATDCASTTFFASLSFDGWHFCGTSEAAPHAAAIAALMRQTDPPATPSSIVAALESSATPFTTVKKRAAVGAGLLNAEAAIAALGGVPVTDPPSTYTGPVAAPSGEEAEDASAPAKVESTGTTVKKKTTTPATKSSSGTAGTTKPRAKIIAHPKPVERTRKSSIVGRFRFRANMTGATFTCQVDGTARRPCGERFQRRFALGRHTVKVRAVASAGGSSGSPVTFSFRVQRVGRSPEGRVGHR
jgi:Subtilase family